MNPIRCGAAIARWFKDNKLVAVGKREYRSAVDRPDVGNMPTPSPGNR